MFIAHKTKLILFNMCMYTYSIYWIRNCENTVRPYSTSTSFKGNKESLEALFVAVV